MSTSKYPFLIPVPPRAPRVKPSRLARWIGRSILRIGGWRMVGELPDVARLVLIGAPHSSNWDGVWGFAAKAALGLDIRVLGKDSLFRVPVLGWAKAANVPIQTLYFHYPDKVIGFGPLIQPGDDLDVDMAKIRAWYAPWMGKNRGTV